MDTLMPNLKILLIFCVKLCEFKENNESGSYSHNVTKYDLTSDMCLYQPQGNSSIKLTIFILYSVTTLCTNADNTDDDTKIYFDLVKFR